MHQVNSIESLTLNTVSSIETMAKLHCGIQNAYYSFTINPATAKHYVASERALLPAIERGCYTNINFCTSHFWSHKNVILARITSSGLATQAVSFHSSSSYFILVAEYKHASSHIQQ